MATPQLSDRVTSESATSSPQAVLLVIFPESARSVSESDAAGPGRDLENATDSDSDP